MFFSSGVHIVKNLECSATFIGAFGKVEDSMDSVCIGWLVCMGVRLVAMPPASLVFQEWLPNFAEWPQEAVLHLFSWTGKFFPVQSGKWYQVVLLCCYFRPWLEGSIGEGDGNDLSLPYELHHHLFE